ncbi:solute symporter family protein [Planctopirus hydrillae]|uniref:Cation acetate symporter n=1 Tax=Planctopirus hydrillae TaxID=1841610 RepID=A0A1C3E4B7_9PLAN|nr:cation acetate symporter [Planctopirus hydrillae]ODA28091.1 cation acetate symporter [Planctopirus hydrillae]
MLTDPSPLAMLIFLIFVGFTLGISFWFASKSKSSASYFAAGGQIPWFVNGVAFAGDYLSAASFLGICGMIARYGYDGFLYSIGFLAGWVVALFVIAEPLKRMGRYTFADALNSRFQSRAVTFAAGLSALVVSAFYLIPQMVGAGALIMPLFGLPHWMGVIAVGLVVTVIVVSAGMVSTTYVQFIKGALLVLFSGLITILILNRGLTSTDDPVAMQPQVLTVTTSGEKLIDGTPLGSGAGQARIRGVGQLASLAKGPNGEDRTSTGPLSPWGFLQELNQSQVILWNENTQSTEKGKVTTYSPIVVSGQEVLMPGRSPLFQGIKSDSIWPKLNFISLMLALFAGTASLPHVLIRYYTVKDGRAARQSTVVGIATIGVFYILTLFLGLGAMTGGNIDLTDSNMAAPLLARTFGELPFALVSAIAFTTVLGTVSGLIVAASGAVVHDLLVGWLQIPLSDHQKVRFGKLVALLVSVMAIGLGIWFQKFNASFLVGWAFSVAASANLPALVMVLFWRRTTGAGVAASVLVGMLSSLTWILLSQETFQNVYGYAKNDAAQMALVPFSQPGIVTIPLGFLVVIVVSLLTRPQPATENE